MFSRHSLMVLSLLTAAGVPYMASSPDGAVTAPTAANRQPTARWAFGSDTSAPTVDGRFTGLSRTRESASSALDEAEASASSALQGARDRTSGLVAEARSSASDSFSSARRSATSAIDDAKASANRAASGALDQTRPWDAPAKTRAHWISDTHAAGEEAAGAGGGALVQQVSAGGIPESGGTHGDAADEVQVPGRYATSDFNEYFRFSITHQWILQKWDRVSARLADVDLQGYRVSLVTGTTPSDLAGSMSYYFDKDQKLEKIVFHGTTADPRRLVTLMTGHFQMEAQSSVEPGVFLYQTNWSGQPWSEMRISPARVIHADATAVRYEVDLMLRR